MSQKKNYKYTAFISYRHIQPDASIAQAVHTMVETFKVPKELQKEEKASSFRVFRDREELTTSSLDDSIDEALRSSEYLIVICSKRLPLSSWCNREVEQFIKLNSIDKVIPVLIEGEPHESFPNILKGYEITETDEEGSYITKTKEILAAELRPTEVKNPDFEGYDVIEKTDSNRLNSLTKESIALLREEKYRIMAAILGVTYGDLRQRDKERRQKRLIFSFAVASVLMLFFGLFMFNAYQNENRAKIQTIQDKSRLMLNNANDLINQGDRIKAILVSNQAIESLDQNMADYQELRNQHYSILNNAMDLNSSSVINVINTSNSFTFLDINNEGNQFIAGLNNDAVGIWDIKTGQLIQSVSGHTQQVKLVQYSHDESVFASGGFDDKIIIWDNQSYEKLGEIVTDGNVMLMVFTKDDSALHVISDNFENYIYQKYSVETFESVGPEIELPTNIKRVMFHDNENQMLINYNTYAYDKSMILYDLYKGVSKHNYSDQEIELLDGTKSKFPYVDVVVSTDFNYFYSLVNNKIVKVEVDTGKLVYQLESNIFNDNLTMVSTSDQQYFYVADGITINKIDSNTGEKVLELRPNTTAVGDLVLSSDDTTLVSLSETGQISIFVDEFLTESNVDYKSGIANYLYLSPDNNHLLALSLTDQNIKTIILNPENASLTIEGQIAAVSNNRHYSLFYGEGIYYLFDNVALEVVGEVSSDLLRTENIYLLDGLGYILSNDGSMIAGLKTLLDDDGTVEQVNIFVIDSKTGEQLYEKEIDMRQFYFGFTDDNQYLFANSSFNEITLYNIDDSNETKTFDVEPGFISEISFSNDSTYFSVSYDEGFSNIYRVSDNELMLTIPGNTLSLINSEEGFEIVSVYNNIGTTYLDFEVQNEVTLTPQRDEKGQFFGDTNTYSKNENLLLTIKDTPDIRYAYLVDFESGQLLKTFEIPLKEYKVKGYFTPDGQSIIFDSVYASTRIGFENDLSLFRENYKNKKSSELYRLLDYDTIHQQSLDYTKDVSLSEQERQQLGIYE